MIGDAAAAAPWWDAPFFVPVVGFGGIILGAVIAAVVAFTTTERGVKAAAALQKDRFAQEDRVRHEREERARTLFHGHVRTAKMLFENVAHSPTAVDYVNKHLQPLRNAIAEPALLLELRAPALDAVLDLIAVWDLSFEAGSRESEELRKELEGKTGDVSAILIEGYQRNMTKRFKNASEMAAYALAELTPPA